MPRLILHSTEFPPGPGGVGTHACQLAYQLSARGWQVVVITPQNYVDAAAIKAFNQAQPFHIVRLRSVPTAALKLLYRYAILNAWLRLWKPDLILASNGRAVWLTALMAGVYRLPWVAVGHGSEFGARSSWERALTRWSFSRADHVICVSNYTRGLMLNMGVRPRAEAVITNGANADLFYPRNATEIEAFRHEYNLADALLLLTVGSVTERKGHDIVIRALPQVLASVPNVRYLIAGLPRCGAGLQELAQSLGIAEHIHFLGRVDEVRLVQIYNACDLFIMTSRQTADGDVEGFGIAAIEAALCSKPAVVSQGTGLEEAVRDGVTGLVVSAEDPAATAAAIIALLSDKHRRLSMGEAARRRALSQQTWPLVAAHYDEVMLTLLADGS